MDSIAKNHLKLRNGVIQYFTAPAGCFETVLGETAIPSGGALTAYRNHIFELHHISHTVKPHPPWTLYRKI